MDLGESISRKKKRDLVLKSVIWNTIITVFLREKNIDITAYLASVTIKGNTILIKTNKPIINTELLLLHEIITQNCQEKLKKMGIMVEGFEVRYV